MYIINMWRVNMKKSILIIFLIVFFISLSSACAENSTEIQKNQDNAANVIYFDANAEIDGNGTQENPYKYLNDNRLKFGDSVSLASGVYEINSSFRLYSDDKIASTFVGENASNTIIKCDNNNIRFVSGRGILNISSITFEHITVENNGILNAKNIIFKDNTGIDKSDYNNSFGGAIKSLPTKISQNPQLNIENCTFINNIAAYGGVIYGEDTVVRIKNSKFKNNSAIEFGGIIAGYSSDILIENTYFEDYSSVEDAGGAFYLVDSALKVINSKFNRGHAYFGGAICILNTTSSIENTEFANHTSKYQGGVIFAMYSQLNITDSNITTSASPEGGFLYINNCTKIVLSNLNIAETPNSIFSIDNNLTLINTTIKNEDIHSKDPFTHDIGFNASSAIIKGITPYKGKLPSRYNLADEGFVTPVRDQQNGGNCWAFAVMAALESSILKSNNIAYDFSEENMKNLFGLYSDYGWNHPTNNGGIYTEAIGYLTSWLGPVLESDDAYDDYSTLSAKFNPIIHIQNILFFDFSNRDAIKRAIMTYGAMPIIINVGAMGDISLHAVCITGWDDEYTGIDKNDPYYDEEIEKSTIPGAWIIKNSWGFDENNDGYIYRMYTENFFEDAKDMQAFAFVLNDTQSYQRNYQYDIGGVTDLLYTDSSKLYYKNVFTAVDNEMLSAFSTYFFEKTKYEAKLYINDELKLTQSGNAEPGYFTIPFKKEFLVKATDKFEIAIKVDKNYLPISEKVSMNKMTYKNNTSFMSFDGKTWINLYDYNATTEDELHAYSSQTACIKVFTRNTNLIDTNIKVTDVKTRTGDEVNITAFVTTKDGRAVNNTIVTFKIGSKNYYAIAKNGTATLNTIFDYSGNFTVKAVLSENNIYKSSQCTFNLDIPVTINAKDIQQLYNTPLNYEVSVYNYNGTPLESQDVIFIVNGKNYTCKSSGGVATLHEKLDVGSNKITIINTQTREKLIKTIKITPRITKNKDITAYYKTPITFRVYAVADNNQAAKNKYVVFKINKKTYKIKTDKKGYAKLKIKSLAPKTYTITSTYKGNTVKNKITVKPTLITKDITVKYKKSSKFTVKVLNTKGKAYSKQIVKINFKGKTYKFKTNSKGIATLKIPKNLKIGKYVIKTTYNGYSIKNKITVKR